MKLRWLIVPAIPLMVGFANDNVTGPHLPPEPDVVIRGQCIDEHGLGRMGRVVIFNALDNYWSGVTDVAGNFEVTVTGPGGYSIACDMRMVAEPLGLAEGWTIE